nr:hypothetical protein [Marinicella sp. W31]MDC2875849.1 hypothetical protein [Marinicella sp. W31]
MIEIARHFRRMQQFINLAEILEAGVVAETQLGINFICRISRLMRPRMNFA